MLHGWPWLAYVRPMATVKPLEELVWYYSASASELGFASNYKSNAIYLSELNEPTGRQCSAARKQSRIRRVLLQLESKHRNALRIAYTPAKINAAIGGRLGQMTGRLAQAFAKSAPQSMRLEELRPYLEQLLRESHASYLQRRGKRPSRRQRVASRVERFTREELWHS